MNNPLFALSTDFGLESSYVAQLKAVLLSAAPQARLVDVTHNLAPFSVRHAEAMLRGCYFAFPLGTVHLMVVDPGVGSSRRLLAVATRGFYFVGPDNGILGLPVSQPDAQVVELNHTELFREPVAQTFHGRDIMAPVAAELAQGLLLSDVGTPITNPTKSTLPTPRIERYLVRGETLTRDRFGNLLTNIPRHALHEGVWNVRVGEESAQFVSTYAEGSPGQLLALIGSDGYLEIARREASAADLLGADLEVVCDKVA